MRLPAVVAAHWVTSDEIPHALGCAARRERGELSHPTGLMQVLSDGTSVSRDFRRVWLGTIA